MAARFARAHQEASARARRRRVKVSSTFSKVAGGRWCPVGTVQRLVSAAASVGAGRLPLADSTRGGSRETPRLSRTVAPRPLSHGCRRASVSAAASVGRWATSHRDVAAPKGEPSLASPFGGGAPTGGGEGKLPAAPSHGLYRSAGGLPSQSRLPPPSGCGSLPAKPPRRQGKSLDKEEPLVLYW